MTAAGAAPKDWERLAGESEKAYAAFLSYRDLGAARSFVAAARMLGRHESLLRRWAGRHRWRERVWAWDLQQTRHQEAELRHHRETVLRERLEEVDRIGRVCLLFFRTMVRRDPETGEVNFHPEFTPQVALRFLEMALRVQGAFDRPGPEDESEEQPAADLFGLADQELEELIGLARERADQRDQGKEHGHEPDTAEQPQGEEQKDRQDEAADS